MDILDDFPIQEKNMEDDKVKELLDLIRDLQNKVIPKKVYWEKLGDFWTKHGFPEWSEECYERIKA